MRRLFALALCLAPMLIACGGDNEGASGDDAGPSSRPDASSFPDAAPAPPDASRADSGEADGGDASEAPDAQPDTGPRDAGPDADAADAEPPLTVLTVNPGTLPVSGGVMLTIIGTGFTGATSVTVYGISVTPFTVVDDSTITLVEPKLPPLYDAGDAGDSIGGDYPLATGIVVDKGDEEAETTAPLSL